MRSMLISVLVLSLFCGCSGREGTADYNVVPQPQSVVLLDQPGFRLGASPVISYPATDSLMERDAAFLADYLSGAVGAKSSLRPYSEGDKPVGDVVLTINPSVTSDEGYRLSVDEGGIEISAKDARGVFYGIQTLRKSIPAGCSSVVFPAGEVNDSPRYGYRGMHLDVCRHFFPVDFIKRYIDILALHNMNTFHWHLTDDQGWRIQIDSYPNLTMDGAWRNGTVIGYHGSGKFDDIRYGGFYTKEELREIVRYASERYITIIPEVDMPGHMLAALSAYPELGCTGGPYEPAKDWGVFDDVLCPGKEEVFTFLEAVFTELMEIFPSEYIHIGGDECPRTRWEQCPDCQARIKSEGLKAQNGFSVGDALQSYTTRRVEKFLNAHGRRIIGWDEILRGELAPNATVMSWRGTAGGIQAAQMGHDVIMTPNSHCYFDFCQTSESAGEPLSIGGCTTVEHVYGFEPSQSLTDEQAAHILGVQANLWTEYITTPEHAEYMVLPRMAALCEVQWVQKGRKDYDNFLSRLVNLMRIYDREGYNYGKHINALRVETAVDAENKAMVVKLSTIDNAPIYYTLDGSQPGKGSERYTAPLLIRETCDFRAVAIRPSGRTPEVSRHFDMNKATFSKASFLETVPASNYTFSGAQVLVDGMRGTEDFANGAWLGWYGDDAHILLDLGKPETFSSFAVTTLTVVDSWIMAPLGLRVSVSVDGVNFTEVASRTLEYDNDLHRRSIDRHLLDFEPVSAQYVRMDLDASRILPPGHGGGHAPSFLFVDEIEIK